MEMSQLYATHNHFNYQTNGHQSTLNVSAVKDVGAVNTTSLSGEEPDLSALRLCAQAYDKSELFNALAFPTAHPFDSFGHCLEQSSETPTHSHYSDTQINANAIQTPINRYANEAPIQYWASHTPLNQLNMTSIMSPHVQSLNNFCLPICQSNQIESNIANETNNNEDLFANSFNAFNKFQFNANAISEMSSIKQNCLEATGLTEQNHNGISHCLPLFPILLGFLNPSQSQS